ncbi:expansin-B3 [Aegilops tauschii subsp. strangulata]|uniref:Expansin-B7 n=1 Tax=Aegilops tauschii subsp. strangulata TaxID=200361 RepID=A0A453J9V7_AEGTS|nr:expansin-B7 [Aegilops tauschii subsp. strangulata]XP_044377208.1 expansin-B7-like [Triticum aestivum]
MASSSSSVAIAAALLLCILAAHGHGCCAKRSGGGGKKAHSHHAPPHAHVAPPPSSPPATGPPSYGYGSPPPPAAIPPPPAANSSSNSTNVDAGGWLDARATWYGAPKGAGPDDNGGACGFKNVNLPPFSAMTSCGNEPLFKDGKGCGSCYQIRCVSAGHPACSGVPETVIITDMNYYPVSRFHFDLSGTAFGAMAKDGRNDELRHAGIIDMQFRRVPCQYPGLTVTFHVQHGSNPYYLAILVEYENGDGDVDQVDIMQSRPDVAGEGGMAPTGEWVPMTESWGSIWRMDTRRPMQGPFSLRITNESGKTLVADQVIPADWEPNEIYSSIIQFD